MIIDRINKYNGYLPVDEITFRSRSGSISRREVVVRGNAVAALVYDASIKKYIFVSQWRPGPTGNLIEVVAGMLDGNGEDPRDAIVREIKEEIGYKVDYIKLIDECYVSPGGSTELVTIYFCEVFEKISNGGGLAHEGEEIDIIEMSFDEMISTRFNDAKTIIAVNWAKFNHKIQ